MLLKKTLIAVFSHLKPDVPVGGFTSDCKQLIVSPFPDEGSLNAQFWNQLNQS